MPSLDDQPGLQRALPLLRGLCWGGSRVTVLAARLRPVLRNIMFLSSILVDLRHEQGFNVASFDHLYGDSMDILSHGGFAWLAGLWTCMCSYSLVRAGHNCGLGKIHI